MTILRKTACFLSIPALLLFALLYFCYPSDVYSAEKKPDAAIAKFNASVLESMKKADKLGYQGRYKLLEPVIKDVFALSFMGSRAMGRHWKKLTPAQQNLYMKTYSAWTVATYAARFDGYSGEKFTISRSSQIDSSTVAVSSSILNPDGKSVVEFKYIMRRISGKWRVVDIRILEVSQLALTRSDFVSVMDKKGFDSLISSLKEKTDAFAGKPKGK